MSARKLILQSHLSPGDIVTMTAAVRDLHVAHPGQFLTDVDTLSPELWIANPYITPLDRDDPEVRIIKMQYPLIQTSNERPRHFVEGYGQFLAERVGVEIPLSAFRGDLHLTQIEAQGDPYIALGATRSNPIWIVIVGGKFDFTTKWWSPTYAQAVVDHFFGRVQFVQCGRAADWHPRLDRVIDLVGRTSLRQMVQLVYHADGVLCPVTFAMHLAAAVPLRSHRLKSCVVVAGGREPPHWEAYPGHQFLHTIGAFSCCATGGCWRSRCQTINDGNVANHENLCELPVQVTDSLRLPHCMTSITPQRVIQALELYL